VFAFSLLYTGPLMALVGVLFQVGSAFGVIAFFIMFFVLTLLLMYHRVGESAVEARKVYQQYKDVAKQTERLGKDLEKIGNDLKDIEKEIEKKKADLLGVQQCIRVIQNYPTVVYPTGWYNIRDETRRLTGSTPSHAPHAEGLLLTKRSQLSLGIANLEKKRSKLEKDKKIIEDKLRA
jgi:cell division protein FtsB